MSFRCVVIDDEKPARERLKRLLAGHDDFEIVGEAADAGSAKRLMDDVEPDLCFLDVRMPEGDGFSVLERVRRIPHVIFTTAYDEYAVRAFEVNSVDYLLKPFSRQRFAEALERARQTLGRPGDAGRRLAELIEKLRGELRGEREGANAPRLARITARRGTKIIVLAPAEILWFEAQETLVFACTRGGRYLVERTLADLETVLAPVFFRCHRRYLVNLARIAEILPHDAGTYEIVLSGEQRHRIPVSRRQARKLKELIPW